ncbi:ABC transporter ATP-binding protein [Proteiniclasticum ruminis]|uniref:ATP-binding cassette, subfamily C n=1 Tax=Proteiniclasticum ruminis TaxID=398199 RepID=A0A1G8T524_9CLOT|nr:ABC transporter ATP-binding protein [Proteiniclasticum ruminis]SDJ36517.1 ATP-binding cassette, subfamily C [Proteiniclasticum ruminis]
MTELLLEDKKGFIRYLIGCFILLSEFLLTNYAIAKIAGVVQTGDLSDLIKYGIFGFLAFIYAGVVFIFSRLLRIGYMRDTTLRIRRRAFENIMTKTTRSFNKKLKNEYISNLVNDINTFEGKYFHALLNLIFGAEIYLASLLILFYLEWDLALIMVGVSFLIFLINRAFQKKTIRMQEDVQRSGERFTVNIANTFSGLEILKLNRIEERFLLGSKRETEKLETRKASVNIFTFWQGRFSNFLGFITTILILYYIISDLEPGYDLTRVMFVISMASSTIWPITEIMPLFNVLKSNATIIENILRKEEEGDRNLEQKPYDFKKTIEVKDLTFSYGDRRIITKGNVVLEKGKKYLLKGASGAGKSTFIQLLSKVYEDYEGEILIDGRDLREISEDSFNQHVSFIYQDVFLFEDSIRNNICLYKTYEEKDIEKAVEGAGLLPLLEKKEKGLEEAVEENGKNLSGGERQRISIARAIIRNPQILFADEVTSSLDESLGRLVEETILSLETTVIAISHRFYEGITEKYDAVIEIKNGGLHLKKMQDYLKEVQVIEEDI